MDYTGKLRKYVEERKPYDEASHRAACKSRLREFLRKRMTTMLVGSIERIEKSMGQNWGHGLSDKECTDGEYDERAIWNCLRKELFDWGNQQIRNMEKGLEDYIVEMRRYKIEFKNNGQNDNQGNS